MGEASAVSEDQDVTDLRRLDLVAVALQAAEKLLGIAMEKPILDVGARIGRRDQVEIDVHADEEHDAIGTRAFDRAAMMVGRAEPRAGLGDDPLGLRHEP